MCFFILTSCSDELTTENSFNETEAEEISKRKISFEEFQEIFNSSDYSTNVNNNSRASNFITEINYGAITEYSSAKNIAYTLPAKTIIDSDKSFSNYIVTQNNDGSITEYLIQYTPNLYTKVKLFSKKTARLMASLKFLNQMEPLYKQNAIRYKL